MATGPNKTVAFARNRKMQMVREEPFKTDSRAAEKFLEEQRAAGHTVRLSSFNIGPKSKPSRQYVVRFYQKGE